MQSAQANHITTFENKTVPRIENSKAHLWQRFPKRRVFLNTEQWEKSRKILWILYSGYFL
jgi:hypothetical protein